MNILKISTDMQSNLIRELSSDSTVTDMLKRVVNQTAEVLRASACAIFITDPGGETATQLAGTGYQEQFVNISQVPVIAADLVPARPTEEEVLGLTSWILSTGRSFLTQTPEDLKQHPHYSGKHDPEQLPGGELILQTFLGVPLRGLRGEVIGLMKAERRVEAGKTEQPFSINEQITLEMAARVASKCLVYLDIAQQEHSREAIMAKMRWAREVISEATATEGELDSFLDIVVKVVAATMRADSCSIYLIDERKNSLTQRAGSGFQAPKDMIRSYLLPSQEQVEASSEPVGLTAWIAATGQTHYAPNFQELSEHPHHRGKYDKVNFPRRTQTECGAFLGMPLKVGGTTIGVLKVENIARQDRPDERDFSEEARRRVDTLAQDVALATVRFQQQSRARYKVISDAQPTIFDILRGGLDVPKLVKRVVEETAKLFNARACALFLKEGNRLIQPPWAAYGWAAKGPEVRYYNLVEPEAITENPEPDEKVGLTVWIAVTREKFTAWSNLELTQHPHHKGTFDKDNFDLELGERCESFMGVPLLVEDRLIGVLKVETKMKRVDSGQEVFTYFSEQDELVFDLIANSAAIAIENAKLLESQRLAEQIDGETQMLLLDLHKTVQNNWHAADTLKQAAGLLRGKRQRVAKIVDNYAAILQPDFNLGHLEAMLNLIEQYGEFLKESGPVSALYGGFLDALRAASLAEISACCASAPALITPQLLEASFSLSDAAKLLVSIFRQVGAELKDGDAGISSVARASILAYLEEQQKTLGQLPEPEQNILCRIVEQWSRIVAEAPEEYVDIVNPYIAGHALQPEEGTPFFGRQDIFDWVAANLHGAVQNNTLVLHGEPRMGKTSILLQLEKGEMGEPLRTRSEQPVIPIFVDLQALGMSPNAARFLYSIADKVHEHPAINDRIDLSSYDFSGDPSAAFNDFMASVSKMLQNTLAVVMLDEFEVLGDLVNNGKLEPAIYLVLRHQILHLKNVAFLLASSLRPEEPYREDSEIIFNVALHQEVSFLDEQNARDLIVKPVEGEVIYEPAAVDELLFLTNGHPWLLQNLCYHLISKLIGLRKDNYISLGHVDAAADHFTGANSRLAPTFWNRADKTARDMLLELASLTDDGRQGVTRAKLENQLVHSPAEIDQSLSWLKHHHFVEETRSAANETTYRPAIPLFSRWIRRNASL